MKFAKTLLAICSISCIVSCSYAPPASPMCRVAKEQAAAPPANAGCIIRVNKWILALTHLYSDSYDIPAGTSAGYDESAQCTAHRGTWEETGFNVEVGPLLGITQSGMHLFACELDDDFGGLLTEFPVPNWSKTEVSSIQLINPFITEPSQWRFPEQLVKIRDVFNQLGKIQAQKATSENGVGDINNTTGNTKEKDSE